MPYTGGIPTTGTNNGPASPGVTGSIVCLFTGSHNEATEWWVDSTTRPTIPALIHTVQVSPGTPVKNYAVGGHTVYFKALVAGDTAPAPKLISVQSQKTTVLNVQYT